MKTKRKYRSKIIESFDHVAFRLLKSKNILKDLFYVKNSYSQSFIDSNLHRFMDLGKIGEAILGLHKANKYSDLCSKDIIGTSTLKRELIWLSNILIDQKTVLNRFIYLRDNFYKSFILCEEDKCLECLDQIEDEFGKSEWLIQNRIGWYGQFKGTEDQKKYSSLIYEDPAIDDSIGLKVKQFSLRELTSLSTKRYDSTISNLTHEMDLAETPAGSTYLKYFLNFYKYFDYPYLQGMVASLMDLPVIDRYSHYLKITAHLMSCGPQEISVEQIISITSRVNESIDDYYLKNIVPDFSSDLHKGIIPFDHYTIGNYSKAKSLCEEYIKSDVLNTHLYETYVKSCYYLEFKKISFMDGTICNKILNDMLSILIDDEYVSALSYERIHKLSYVFSADLHFSPIIYFAKKEYRYLEDEQEKYYNNLASLSSSSLNPKRIAYSDDNSLHEKYLNNPSVEFLLTLKSKNYEKLKLLDIDEKRKDIYYAKLLYENKHFKESLEIFQKLSLKSDILINGVAVYFSIKIQLECELYEECLNFAGNTLLADKSMHLKVPITKIITFIESLNDNYIYRNINLLFIYHFYSVTIGSDKNEEFCDAYDEFMYAQNIKYPLDIESKSCFTDNQKLFFLKNICIPNVIDVSDAYRTNEEVISERMQICYTMIDLDPDNFNDYDNEITALIDKIIIEKSKAQITEGRIYVDTESLKSILAQQVREKLIIFHSLKKNVGVEKKYVRHNDKHDDVLIPTDDLSLLIVNTIEEVSEQFCINSEYGLDGNISLEIRHGHIAAQLRCPFEKGFLVTEKDGSGKYIKNNYWFQKYPIVTNSTLMAVDRCLRSFSKKIDDLIEEVRSEWLKVHFAEGAFALGLEENDVLELETKLLSGPSELDVLDFIFDILWEKTEFNLEEIKSRFANDLVLKIEAIINELNVDLVGAKGGVFFQDLDDAIQNAKNDVHASIDEICKWFNRSRRNEFIDFELILPLKLSIETFCSVYNFDEDSFEIQDIVLPKPISGEFLNDFVMIFMTLFQNIKKHSRLSPIPPIKIETELTGGTAIVKISNKILLDDLRVGESARLKEINDVMRDRKYYDVVNTEGKTGLYKVDKILNTKLKSGHKLSFEMKDDEFSVQISFALQRLYS